MIIPLLDAYFKAKANQGREIAGGMTWRASRLGFCLRAQYIESVEKRKAPEIDARTARIFEVGHLTARMVGRAFSDLGILLAEELPLHDKDLDLGGHVDFIIGGRVRPRKDAESWSMAFVDALGHWIDEPLPTIGVELKSKNSKSFWWATKKGEPVADAGQRTQAAAYGILAERNEYPVDEWVVLSVSKDDLSMAVTPVEREDKDYALARIHALNDAKDKQDPLSVPCSCFSEWGGRMKQWCPYYVKETDVCCEEER